MSKNTSNATSNESNQDCDLGILDERYSLEKF